jgi:hypothetical protein
VIRKIVVNPAAVRATAARLRSRGAAMSSHGDQLRTATSGRIGHGALGETVDNLVKRGLHAVTDGVTGAVRKLHDDTATGLERAIERTAKDDRGAKSAFDDLEHGRHDGAGTAHGGGSVGGGDDGGGGGTSAPPAPKPPKHRQPVASTWQANGGTIEYHDDGSITYTTGPGHKTGPGVSVTYDKRGFPDFSDYRDHPSGVTHVTFEGEYAGNRTSDFSDSNRMAATQAQASGTTWDTTGPRSPDGYTWHHDQDLTTMHLVDRDTHSTFSHTGGVSLKKWKSKIL